MSTELEKILLAYPDESWDFYYLTYNKKITVKFIFKHPEFPWRYNNILYRNNGSIDFQDIIDNLDKFDINRSFWVKLTEHRVVTMDIINNNPSLSWEYSRLGYNPNVTMEMLDKYQGFIETVRYNKNITIEYMKLNIQFEWKMTHLYGETQDFIELFKSLSYEDIEYILDNPSRYSPNEVCTLTCQRAGYHIDLFFFITSISLSFDDIVRLSHKCPRITNEHLSYRHDITEEYILDNIEQVNFNYVSEKIEDIEIIKRNPDIKWSYQMLIYNRHLTIKDIRDLELHSMSFGWTEMRYLALHFSLKDISENLDLRWDWEAIGERDDLNMNFILDHKQYFENYSININNGMSLDVIEQYPNINWKYNTVLLHKDLTLEIFNKYIDRFGDFKFSNLS